MNEVEGMIGSRRPWTGRAYSAAVEWWANMIEHEYRRHGYKALLHSCGRNGNICALIYICNTIARTEANETRERGNEGAKKKERGQRQIQVQVR